MLHQRVGERSISFVFTTFEPFIKSTYIFTTEAFDDDNHYILLASYERIARSVDRRIYLIELLLRIVVRHNEYRFAYGADDRERSVQYYSSLLRTVYILIGIANGDRAHSGSEATTYASHTQRNKDGKACMVSKSEQESVPLAYDKDTTCLLSAICQ